MPANRGQGTCRSRKATQRRIRERPGTPDGVSIRVARGLYCLPLTLRSRPIEWEETVPQDTGLLGLATKHICCAGNRKKFRVRHGRMVSLDRDEGLECAPPSADGGKDRKWRLGDGWACH